MSKRKRMQNYTIFIKEGRGQGDGINNKPWITIQDLSSMGRSTRV